MGFLSDHGAIDLAHVRRIDISMDTWDSGFTVDLDALSFEVSDTGCDVQCPGGCSGRGQCDHAAGDCVCDLGAVGSSCSTCAVGFVGRGGACVLARDGDHDTWPNDTSSANSDPWLAVHH